MRLVFYYEYRFCNGTAGGVVSLCRFLAFPDPSFPSAAIMLEQGAAQAGSYSLAVLSARIL